MSDAKRRPLLRFDGSSPRTETAGHDPSAWGHRLVVALLAAAGCAVSVYLALYELDVLTSVWDPVFGAASSRRVLHSAFSEALPVPDAALGAANYLLEIVLELAGGSDRWRSRPWLVALLGLAVTAGVAASIVLVLIQGLVYGHFCFLCLCSAGISFAIAAGAALELAATARHVSELRRAGVPLARALASRDQPAR